MGDAFTIIDNLSATPVSGQFIGLPEGSVFAAGAELFQITYFGGDGNDVVLTAVIPEPAAAGVLLLCCLTPLRIRRRGRRVQ